MDGGTICGDPLSHQNKQFVTYLITGIFLLPILLL